MKMHKFNSVTQGLIKKACKGKKHIKLTIGFILDKDMTISTFGESGEIDTENGLYEIGSITKTFTASLMSKFIYENKMQLNDSIQKYVPELTRNKYYPTIHRLATHVSGYPGWYPLNILEYFRLFMNLIFGGNIQRINPIIMDSNKMLMLLEKSNLKDRDYKWAYSNFGISLLGYAVGKISGKGYWDTMNDFLKNELNLKTAHLGSLDGKSLKGYNTKNEECGNWQWDENNLMAPAGAINLNAEDLLNYAKMNMNEKKPYFALCHQKHGKNSKKYDMGLAWWLHRENNNIIEHEGGTGCFCSYLGIDKAKKVSSIVLSNYRLGINLNHKIGISILKNL
jgi:CubicO group peptidase (beta-lactamase class C family)